MVFLPQLSLAVRELELLLRELLFLRNERLLVLVHFATLVEQSGRRGHRVQFLGRYEALFVIHIFKKYKL